MVEEIGFEPILVEQGENKVPESLLVRLSNIEGKRTREMGDGKDALSLTYIVVCMCVNYVCNAAN